MIDGSLVKSLLKELSQDLATIISSVETVVT